MTNTDSCLFGQCNADHKAAPEEVPEVTHDSKCINLEHATALQPHLFVSCCQSQDQPRHAAAVELFSEAITHGLERVEEGYCK